MLKVDVVVIGGGPAGSSAAIACSQAGLRVALIERQTFPRYRPGETLHPGIESILTTLGIVNGAAEKSIIRPKGIKLQFAETASLIPFGNDQHGNWSGFQVKRKELDSLLLTEAKDLGVEVICPSSPKSVITDGQRVLGVQTDALEIRACFTIDASGHRHWLTQEIGNQIVRVSQPIFSQCGYANCSSEDFETPVFRFDEQGWYWLAAIDRNEIQWTRTWFRTNDIDRTWTPSELQSEVELSRSQGFNVTWRHVTAFSGSGYLIAGDAASIVDPASSRGVLKALMSGILAAKVCSTSLSGSHPEAELMTGYSEWIYRMFWHDVNKLNELYSEHPLWVPVKFKRSR